MQDAGSAASSRVGSVQEAVVAIGQDHELWAVWVFPSVGCMGFSNCGLHQFFQWWNLSRPWSPRGLQIRCSLWGWFLHWLPIAFKFSNHVGLRSCGLNDRTATLYSLYLTRLLMTGNLFVLWPPNCQDGGPAERTVGNQWSEVCLGGNIWFLSKERETNKTMFEFNVLRRITRNLGFKTVIRKNWMQVSCQSMSSCL